MARPATAAVRLLTGEREPVRLATTVNITLSGLQTIDGVLTEVGDRVLVKDQDDATTNGIYTVSAGPWYRASDARTSRTIQKGTSVTVQEGTVSGSRDYRFTVDDPDIGTDDIIITIIPSLEAVEADIDALQVRASNTETDVGMLENRATEIEADIIIINADQDTQDAQILALDGRLDALEIVAALGAIWHLEVAVASIASGTLATAFENGDVIDDVTLTTGMRILIKNQSSAAENGIYTVNASGAPTRATDADTGAEIFKAAVSVTGGTTNASRAYICYNLTAPTLGSDPVTFARLPDGSSYATRIAALEAEAGTAVDGTIPYEDEPLQWAWDSNSKLAYARYKNGATYLRPSYYGANEIERAAGFACTRCIDGSFRVGQSNQTGYRGVEPVNWRGVSPRRAIILNNNQFSPQSSTFNPATATAFMSVAEQISGDYGEGGAGAALLGYLAEHVSGDDMFFALNASQGDRDIQRIGKGGDTPCFNNSLAMAWRAYSLAKYREGRSLIMRWLDLNQGETGFSGQTAALYAGEIADFYSDYNTDWKAMSGQTADLIMTMVQTRSDKDSTFTPSAALGQVMARDADHLAGDYKIFMGCAGPYWATLADNTHFNADGKALIDETVARAKRLIFYDRGKTYPTSVVHTTLRFDYTNPTIVGNDITFGFWKPSDALDVYDESTDASPILTANGNGRGFQVRVSDTPITINSISISNVAASGYDGAVTAHCATSPSGFSEVSYARRYGTTGLTHSASWGNLAADVNEYSLSVPNRKLLYWAEIF